MVTEQVTFFGDNDKSKYVDGSGGSTKGRLNLSQRMPKHYVLTCGGLGLCMSARWVKKGHRRPTLSLSLLAFQWKRILEKVA